MLVFTLNRVSHVIHPRHHEPERDCHVNVLCLFYSHMNKKRPQLRGFTVEVFGL